MACINFLERYDALLAIKLMDVSGAGQINSKYLKTLKDFYGSDFSRFVGANNAGNWTINAPTTEWAGLENVIGRVMHQAVPIDAYDTLIRFPDGEFKVGALLAGEGVVYAMTGSPTESICTGTLNLDPATDDSNCEYSLPTRIISVQYRTYNPLSEAITINPFANAKTVVVNALGAVNAAALLNTIYNRPAIQSIRKAIEEGLTGDAYIRRSNKVWNLVQRGLVRESANFRGIGGGGIDTATLENSRRRLDETDMTIYPAPIQNPAAERFAMLKIIAAGIADVIRSMTGLGKGLDLPTEFLELFGGLTISLHGENPDAYTTQKWDAKLESYRQSLVKITDIINGYATGSFMQLNAAERAGREFLTGGTGGDLTVTGAGTGNAGANPIPPVPPADLQAVADVLSKLAVIRGKLDWTRSGDLIRPPSRDIRYAFKTRRVIVNGKRRFLMIVKMKESGKKTVYVAQFIDNKNELISNRTAWRGATRDE
jgi:hypothetical protein